MVGLFSSQNGKTKEHLEGLDVLRGFAALGVLIFHFAGRIDLPYIFAHGYLAVDFFFILSGFIMARAYGAKIALRSVSIRNFYVIRAIRLLPLVVLGTLLAATFEYGRTGIVDQSRHAADVAIAILFGSLLIPIFQETTLEHVLFPLNGPAWSLLFEAISNIAFAPIRQLHADWVVVFIVLISGATLALASSRFSGLNIGSSASQFPYGFARIGWGFGAGIILYHWRNRAPGMPFWLPMVALVAILSAPPTREFSAIFDNFAVLVALPCIVFASATATPGPIIRGLTWTGEISFALYAVHYPLVRVFSFKISKMQLSVSERLFALLIGTVLIMLFSAVVYKFYDIPLRRWLYSALVKQTAAPRAVIDIAAVAPQISVLGRPPIVD